MSDRGIEKEIETAMINRITEILAKNEEYRQSVEKEQKLFDWLKENLEGEPLEGVNKIAKTIENKGFSRKGKADGKNFVRWKPLHILERCKEKRQGKAAVRHGLGIVFKL